MSLTVDKHTVYLYLNLQSTQFTLYGVSHKMPNVRCTFVCPFCVGKYYVNVVVMSFATSLRKL